MGGKLVDGQWVTAWYDTKSNQGRFVRQEQSFRDWIGSEAFPAEKDRYHLYISHACPWAHRTHIFWRLKELQDVISLSVVNHLMADDGWTFEGYPDPIYGLDYLREIYVKADPQFTGRVTVPVLWDKKTETIVNNESSEIIQMLNTEFQAFANDIDFFPPTMQSDMDKINALVYDGVNNGVYKAGFAGTQEAYEEAVTNLFRVLEQLDERLSKSRYLLGPQLTAADWRLFTTLVRFDAVYVGHFKCNLQRIADYQHLSGYLRELYQWPEVKATVHFDHIKKHYYQSHLAINPTGVIPKGPLLDLEAPHGRDALASEEVGKISER